LCRFQDHLVLGLAATGQREVEVPQGQLEAEHLGVEETKGLLEQFLAGLVAVEDDHARGRGHDPAC
jgi:hypothetical protein